MLGTSQVERGIALRRGRQLIDDSGRQFRAHLEAPGACAHHPGRPLAYAIAAGMPPQYVKQNNQATEAY